jgi:ABC-2 type transport system ATP-binding protein
MDDITSPELAVRPHHQDLPPTPVASLRDVGAGYGNTDILHGVSMELRAARVLVLFGPNGAGKSTLVRVLTGTLPPRRGAVQRAAATAADRRPVGLVPQEIALYPWLTPRENCRAFARLDGIPAAEVRARLDDVLRLTRCHDVADQPVSRLSGGYRRRVNIAVALMSAPQLLILDEPTVGLDSDARGNVVEILRAVAARGAAVLVITHDFEVATAIADDLAILAEGRVLAEGAPADLLSTAFGGRKLVELVFTEAPDARQQAALAARGAVPGRGRQNWLLRRPQSYDAAALEGLFADVGLQTAEFRIRQPGLDDLYTVTLRRGLSS